MRARSTWGPGVLGTAMIGLLGCQEGEVSRVAPDATFSVSDSAGVEVIRYWGEDTPLDVTRVLRIGVVDGDPHFEFHRIRTISPTEDGGFWLVDGHASVRRYDGAGSYVNAVGGSGEGPGEAQGYGSAWAGNGRVLASGHPGGLQLFDSQGELLWTGAAQLPDGALMTPLGRAGDHWVLRVDRAPESRDPVFRRSTEIFAVDSLGTFGEPALAFAGDLRTNYGGRGSYLAGNPHVGLDPQGRLVVSDTVEYRLRVFDLNGTLLRTVERTLAPRPMDESMVRDIREATETAVLRGPFGDRSPSRPLSADERSEVEHISSHALGESPVPHVPFIGGVLVGRGGTTWVRRGDLDPQPGLRAVAHAFGYVRWGWHAEWVQDQFFDVYAGTHELLGTVRIPGDFWPMAVHEDLVYGVSYDELGVEFVDVYRFRL